jgi:hypothetical protein
VRCHQLYAAECETHATEPDISIRRANVFRAMRKSWATLAKQKDRLSEVENEESK